MHRPVESPSHAVSSVRPINDVAFVLALSLNCGVVAGIMVSPKWFAAWWTRQAAREIIAEKYEEKDKAEGYPRRTGLAMLDRQAAMEAEESELVRHVQHHTREQDSYSKRWLKSTMADRLLVGATAFLSVSLLGTIVAMSVRNSRL